MTVNSWVSSLRRSIFFRLLLVFLATAILLAVLVASSANYLSDPKRFIHQKIEANLQQYTHYLIQEMGDPPDFQKANDLANSLSLAIHIKSQNTTWQSNDYDIPQKYLEKQHHMTHAKDFRIGHYRGYSFVIIKNTPYEYHFVINHKRFTENKIQFLLMLIFSIIIVITFSYLLVRWLFRPIRWLNTGVAEVSKGNFKVQVPIRKHDEIGELAEAFNQMATQIDSMIKNKEQLLLDVSHELRSPLTRMKLAMEFVDNEEAKQSIQEDLREMETMIAELLESARFSSNNNQLKKTTFSLKEMLSELIFRYENSSPGVVLLQPQSSVSIHADYDRLQIVLRNLLDNAVKYSKHQSRPVEISVSDQPTEIILSIKDYGEGIPREDLTHIFDPFYRVDKSRNTQTGGYGLGLSLCHKIIIAHGGTINAESEIDKQTQFRIELPKTC